MSPAEVARQALAGLDRGPVLVPGLLNRLLVRLLTTLPRRLGVLAAGKGMRDTLRRSRERRAP
jgi:hypothetical protein